MGTTWSKILINSMQIVNDTRWEEQLALSPAQFFRAKSEMLKCAIPLLNSPPELLSFLTDGLVSPEYGSIEWETDENSLSNETVIQTEFLGYSLMSCTVRIGDCGESIPYEGALYDSATGEVTFPVQESTGIQYELDFYEDGEFKHELTMTQMRLLALAMAIVWDEHFSSDWLNRQPKIHDSSFETVNEANYTEKVDRELVSRVQKFNDELHKYEQICAYNTAINRYGKSVSLV